MRMRVVQRGMIVIVVQVAGTRCVLPASGHRSTMLGRNMPGGEEPTEEKRCGEDALKERHGGHEWATAFGLSRTQATATRDRPGSVSFCSIRRNAELFRADA